MGRQYAGTLEAVGHDGPAKGRHPYEGTLDVLHVNIRSMSGDGQLSLHTGNGNGVSLLLAG